MYFLTLLGNLFPEDFLSDLDAHRRFRGIESRVLKICDFKKVIFAPFFKHNITGFGVLIPKRYHMLG